MLRGPLGIKNYKPRFSGHETFPFRYTWIPKLVKAIQDLGSEKVKKLHKLELMVTFGVGINMAESIKHWGKCLSIIDENCKLTKLGHKLFLKHDPFIDQQKTLWILHWHLANNPLLTTWFWCFNYHDSILLDKNQIIDEIKNIARNEKWKHFSPNTIARDVDCFFRAYTVSYQKNGSINEDSLECPLSELSLIHPTVSKGTYEFQRGPKSTLSHRIFAYALADFWKKNQSNIQHLTVDKITYDKGSPGKVFQLDEKTVLNYLTNIEQDKTCPIRLIDGGGGLKQIHIEENFNPLSLLEKAYQKVEIAA